MKKKETVSVISKLRRIIVNVGDELKKLEASLSHEATPAEIVRARLGDGVDRGRGAGRGRGARDVIDEKVQAWVSRKVEDRATVSLGELWREAEAEGRTGSGRSEQSRKMEFARYLKQLGWRTYRPAAAGPGRRLERWRRAHHAEHLAAMARETAAMSKTELVEVPGLVVLPPAQVPEPAEPSPAAESDFMAEIERRISKTLMR